MDKTRCGWIQKQADNPAKEFYVHYHDTEWGVPVHDDRLHFEMINLEGAQAGLSWETVLKKRDAYRKAFKNFDAVKCARLTDDYLEKQMLNDGIIRNRLKIFGVRKNAKAFLAIQKEFGSFDTYVWRFVGGKPIDGKGTFRVSSPESDALSKDLKKRGMTFVGTTIMYAYLQAIGLINDHGTACFRYAPTKKLK